jgi:hypothetical protein
MPILFEPFLPEISSVSPTRNQLLSGVQSENRSTVVGASYASYSSDSDDYPPVGSYESVAIEELLFEARKRLSNQVRIRADVKRHVVSL